jgi:uncharacterized protein (DUF1330 family)
MPAYIITTRRGPVRDEEAMAEYQRRTRAMKGNFKLTPKVIYGAVEGLEGDVPDGVVMLEFPSMDDAKAWYNNDEYQAAIPYRQKAADYEMFIVEGLAR